MEKLKDFLYDKNDILVALLVLALAALLITWRMNVIMEYPEKMFADSSPSDSQTGDEPFGDIQEGSQDGSGQSGTGEGSSAVDPDSQDGQSSQDGGSDALWADGMLTREVEVDVYGNSAMAAVNCLVDAGLFAVYAEYQKICEDTGLNHEKVSAGTLTFPAGTTKKDIARKINWS